MKKLLLVPMFLTLFSLAIVVAGEIKKEEAPVDPQNQAQDAATSGQPAEKAGEEKQDDDLSGGVALPDGIKIPDGVSLTDESEEESGKEEQKNQGSESVEKTKIIN